MNKPTVYILRGIPGSGKSTFVKNETTKVSGRTAVCSADDYFEKCDCQPHCNTCSQKTYKFNPAKLKEAHEACKTAFLWHVNNSTMDVVFVDNTNTSQWECDFYVKVCQDKGLEFTIVNMKCDLEKAIARNVHGVPPEKVRQMAERIRTSVLPASWPQIDYSSE